MPPSFLAFITLPTTIEQWKHPISWQPNCSIPSQTQKSMRSNNARTICKPYSLIVFQQKATALHARVSIRLDTYADPLLPPPFNRIRSASLQKASSSLAALNEFSAVKWVDLHPKFEAHTKLIKELQGDLDHIFRKIR